MRALVVGGGGREHALATELHRAEAEVVAASPNANPGIERLALESLRSELLDPGPIVDFARHQRVDLAVIGPEAPLAAGLADALRAAEIPVVGPDRAAARIEWSKRFCRELMAKHGVPGLPKFQSVMDLSGLNTALANLPGPFVVKPSGLTSGKGVWVQGSDFQTPDEGAAYARALLAQPAGRDGLLLEEKLVGEEFSLMAFVTDSGLYPMPAVQDYKRALEGNQGGNTGGMGSYSQRDQLLPFLSTEQRDRALEILRKSVAALRAEGLAYRGVLYGGFMLTPSGPQLIEFNARFGDPEALNVLSIYESGDFGELMLGVATGRVDPNLVGFRQRATVVKYLVPVGYGSQPQPGATLELDETSIDELGVRIYFGAAEAAGAGRVKLTSSRGVALVGEASAIHEAHRRVESALAFVKGSYYVRHDIGSPEDVGARVERMRQLIAPGAKSSPLPLSVAAADAAPKSHGDATQVLTE
ncbi:MAG: phosphoribosylamine--glycine ligase [Thermoplasmata archaeon]|nr:phosphoribosylamine--glycine ligase [Thermoplasmata archaeon]